MKISLHKKILLPLLLTIITVSFFSTYICINAHKEGIENQLIARGFALTYALSNAAKEGIVLENLDLIRKAHFIIHANDVIFVQVYSNLWDVIDSYPFSSFNKLPDNEAVEHFKKTASPFHIRAEESFDFYKPIHYTPLADSPETVIGFVKISLSTSSMNREIKQALFVGIITSVIATIISIAALSFLITHIITRRIKDLWKNILLFKDGAISGTYQQSGSRYADDEISDVFSEFDRMSREITEKENKLVEARERIVTLFDRVEHAIFRTDNEGGITEANKKFTDLFGKVEKICTVLEDVDCIIRASVEGQINMEKKVQGRDGKELFIMLFLYAETDKSGHITGFDGYIVDLTQQKRLEEILLHKQKMEAVGTLAGGVAHDFNNILTAIISYGNLLLMKMGKEDPLKYYVEQILSVSNKAANLIQNLLSFSRKQIIHPKPVDLNAIVKNVENLLARLIGEDIEMRIKLVDEHLGIVADVSQIEQVLMNLATNARDAMPEGGLLSIETKSLVIDSAGCNIYDLELPGPYAMISVSDSGKGMEEKTKEKVFEPFFTTKETGKGTGLGLAIIYGIIKQHGGNINVYSETGKGTTFKIYLPMKTPVSQEINTETLSAIKGGTETILLAEDDIAVRNAVREILERGGYNILEAKDGEEAVRIFSEHMGRIQLVMLDVIMPKKNGKEACNEIRDLSPHVKTVFISGYADNRKGMLGEGFEYIQKPFIPEVLLKRVREILDAV